MTNLKLSNRMQSIANMVDKNSKVLDVGCDHALIDIYLLLNKKVKKVIASDINENALNMAKTNILSYNIKDISIRCGNGLDILNKSDDVNTVIISGMGYKTIINILSNKDKLNDINTIIIQSNNHVSDIRKYMVNNNYYIKNEELSMDKNIIYTVIKFKKGQCNYTKKELQLGPCILKNKNKLFIKYINNLINKNTKILKSLPAKKLIKKIKILYIIKQLKKEI